MVRPVTNIVGQSAGNRSPVHGLTPGDPSLASPDTLRVWVVPHTHWDREWYLPFEQFRIHLARTVDDLIGVLEQNPAFQFTLDGQAVILEDYLELRPEQEGRLRRLLASGRIVVGPSYVLPDEFLVGQESLVRNLLRGRQVAGRYGARPMAVGYAPDTFGHIAQLPQILQGFGIDSFVFWRGLGDEADLLGAVFQWQGPDGSRLLAVRLLEGYANARNLGQWTRRDGWVLDDPKIWPEAAALRVAEFLERWSGTLRRSGTNDVLLGNGVDHEPVQRDLPEMLRACEARLPGVTFQIGSFEGYVEALRQELANRPAGTEEAESSSRSRGCPNPDGPSSLDPHPEPRPSQPPALATTPAPHRRSQTGGTLGSLQVVEGELVGGREACVVRSVNSTRIYLKQANEAIERALFVAEALASLAFLRDRRPYPRNELGLAWRELLRNHPHDSLPGCSLDEVHRDMEQRFRSAQQIARQLQREALASLAGQIAPLRPWEDRRDARSLVNVLPWTRTGLAHLELPEGLERVRGLVADTPDGPLPVQIEGSGPSRRALLAAELPGFGSRRVRLRAGRGPAPSGGARSSATNTIENEYYRVTAAENGSLSVTDLQSGELWSGLHRFQDEADRGDEYSFCPVEGDLPWDGRGLEARVRVLAAGPVVAEMEITIPARLPRALRSNRRARSATAVGYPIRTVVRLTAGIDRIEFRTTLENRAADHRLRVLFPAPSSDQWVRAEGHFAMLRRPAQPVWNGQWREPPTRTHHTLGVVAAGKLALMARGLPEYEAIPNPEGGVDLALTLLRCVGWLSWSDLATRPGAEDPHVPTPEAQCPGSHSFEYALSLRGEETDAYLVRAAQDYRVELVDGPAGIELDGTLRVEGDGFGFSALKGAEKGDGIILRLYNPGQAPAVAQVGGRHLVARRCRLDETAEEPEGVEAVPMRGGEIATLTLVDSRERGDS